MAILTVSRQYGSGSSVVNREIMTSLHYTLVDKEVLLKDIRATSAKWETWAKELDDIAPHFWEKYDRSFRGFGALLQSILLNYALRDNVILRGRGANFLLEGIPHAFRIHLVAPLDVRIERISLRDSIDQETARLVIEKTDGGKAGFVQALYGKDWEDDRYYDAVFDTGRQAAEEVGRIVERALVERNDLKTQAALNLLSLRAVSAKIKAKLITDPRLYVPVLDVVSTETEVVLRGIVRNSDQFRRIVDAALELAGEWPLKIELRYRV
jgi:cytidylate kinase